MGRGGVVAVCCTQLRTTKRVTRSCVGKSRKIICKLSEKSRKGESRRLATLCRLGPKAGQQSPITLTV